MKESRQQTFAAPKKGDLCQVWGCVLLHGGSLAFQRFRACLAEDRSIMVHDESDEKVQKVWRTATRVHNGHLGPLNTGEDFQGIR
eukprot:6462227-Amphidinium_carterae.1